MDREFGADVDADGGPVEDEDGGLGGEPLGQDDLLLVAARQGVDGVGRVGGDDIEALHPLLLFVADGFLVDESEGLGEGFHFGDRDVFADRAREEEAFGESVFGDVGDAGCDRVAYASQGDVLAFDADAPGVEGEHPEERHGEFGASGAQQAGDAEDFAGSHAQGGVGEGAGNGCALDLEDRGVGDVAGLVALLVEVAPGHVAGEAGAVEFFLRAGDNFVSASQNGEALRDFEDFFELVGDEEDCDAARLQVGDDVEEGAHFLLGEGGRGLVHDDEFRVAHECAADGDELFVGDGEVADEFVEVDLEADFGDGFAGDFAHARAVDEAASGGDFAAERDVLHDGEVGEDGEVLVDDAYARVDGVGGCQARKLAAPDGDRALFGGVDSGDDFDEGGFARPVFSGEAVDFSGRDVKVDVDQGSHACEGFADVSYRQHWGVHVVSFPTRGADPGPRPRSLGRGRGARAVVCGESVRSRGSRRCPW